jgi:hypothetical protein
MNCQACREEFAAHLEGLLDEIRQAQFDSHLAGCPACQAELQEVRQLTARLASQRGSVQGDSPIFAETKIGTVPAVSLESVVMGRIVHLQALEIRRLKMRKRLRVLGISGAMAAAIAVLLLASFWFAEPAAAERAAAEALAQGAEATPNPSSIHIVAKVRTIAHDNFMMIGEKYDFVRVDVWKQFGDKSKWRVEKPGRVVVMDGESTVMLIRPDHVVQFPHATPAAFDTGWLLALTEVQDMITHELRAAQARKWDLKLDHVTTGAGDKVLVTVEAKSGLPAGDYLKNKFFEDADTRRVYRFDAKTKRLEGFDAYLHGADGDVLILSVERIEYDRPIDATVFTLKLPDKVSLLRGPERLPDNEKYERMTPEQSARAFFEACGKRDWDEARKFMSPCDERMQSYLGGLQIVRLGTPFQSKGYGGWFIPYEIKVSAKAKIVVRNDKPAKRYLVFMDPHQAPNAKALAEVTKLPDNEKYQKMTPKEAAQAFFDAWARKDLEGTRKFLDAADAKRLTPKDIEDQRYADVQVGEPTKTENAGCWSVPIEIRFTHKHNLALRNDNPVKRFIVDGGI